MRSQTSCTAPGNAMVTSNLTDQLQTLTLTPDDIEAQTGLTVNSFCVGGLLGGVYRLSARRPPQYWLQIWGTEFITLALMTMLSIPIGLATLRDQAPVQTSRFVWITGTVTTVIFAGWHLYQWHRAQTLQVLMRLLDDIDQYNQLVETVAVLDHLSQASHTVSPPGQQSVLKALSTSRASLVTGLQLEALMRRHRRLLSRSQTLWLDLEQALTTLQSIEIKEQAQEYQNIINQALWISMSVQTTVQKLSSDQANSS